MKDVKEFGAMLLTLGLAAGMGVIMAMGVPAL